MGGFTKVESKIGVGTKFIINTKVKCRRVVSDLDRFDSNKSDINNQKFVFISKDNKESELKNLAK